MSEICDFLCCLIECTKTERKPSCWPTLITGTRKKWWVSCLTCHPLKVDTGRLTLTILSLTQGMLLGMCVWSKIDFSKFHFSESHCSLTKALYFARLTWKQAPSKLALIPDLSNLAKSTLADHVTFSLNSLVLKAKTGTFLLLNRRLFNFFFNWFQFVFTLVFTLEITFLVISSRARKLEAGVHF